MKGEGLSYTRNEGAKKVVHAVLYLQISQHITVKSYDHATGTTWEREMEHR